MLTGSLGSILSSSKNILTRFKYPCLQAVYNGWF